MFRRHPEWRIRSGPPRRMRTGHARGNTQAIRNRPDAARTACAAGNRPARHEGVRPRMQLDRATQREPATCRSTRRRVWPRSARRAHARHCRARGIHQVVDAPQRPCLGRAGTPWELDSPARVSPRRRQEQSHRRLAIEWGGSSLQQLWAVRCPKSQVGALRTGR